MTPNIRYHYQSAQGARPAHELGHCRATAGQGDGSARRCVSKRVRDTAPGKLPPYNTKLFCPPSFDTVSREFMQKGAAVFEGYRNIGWRPWEPVVFPKAWWPYAFELVDEVWASSQFLFDMYKQATDKPVKLVPLAVSVERMKPYPRRHYGLPEGKFLFLYIFDFNSTVACKNLMAAVQALFAFSPTKAPVSPQHEAFRIVTEVRCHCLEVREDGMLGAEEQMLPITFLFQKA